VLSLCSAVFLRRDRSIAGRMHRVWASGPFYFALLLCGVLAAGHVTLQKIFFRYVKYHYRDVVQEFEILLPADHSHHMTAAQR
jgi:hypothetical protein